MLIEINVDLLIKNGLTASQYVMLKLLNDGNVNTFALYALTAGREEELQDLVTKGYLLGYNPEGDINTVTLAKTKVGELFALPDGYFWEFFGTYPIKVNKKSGGQRILRSSSPDSREAKICEQKYMARVKTLNQHKHVMRCLEAEMWHRRKGNDMEFMQQMVTYINQESWSKYEGLLELSSQVQAEKQKPKYGQKLI